MIKIGVCGAGIARSRRTRKQRAKFPLVATMTPGRVAASVLALAVVGHGCDREKPPQPTEVVTSALNASPKLGDFVLEAQNSIRLQTGGLVINGGDIGARGTGSGPFLSGGVAIDVLTGVQTQTTHNIIADSVRLGTGVTVGDIQTNRFVNGVGATHGTVSGLVPLPAVPAACGASPGTANLTVGTGATVTASAGQFAAVSIGTGGKLRLNSGRYDMTSLTVGTSARIEILGSVQIRVAGRLSTSSGSFIGAASGTTLTARDLHVEISGQNGTTGALGATPPAASLGTGNVVTALILVPNGTLSMGTGIVATGAFMARDLDVGGAGARIVFQDGFAACTGAGCDDGNPCTVDGCSACGECTHAAASAGTSCSDGNACDGSETCDGAGHCVPGTPVNCAPPGQCHSAGVCNPATGLCVNPPLPDGTPCNDGNLCTQTDTCQSGLCVGSHPVACGSGDQCTDAGTCNPATGVCSKPAKPNGTLCNDSNACTQADVCEGGKCTGTEPVACGLPDQCHVAGVCDPTTGVCSNPAQPDGTSCTDGNACTRSDTCQAGVCMGANPVKCVASDQCHDMGACDSATGACSNPAKANGTGCDDGNACSQGDTCQGGACTGSTWVACGASDQCHAAGVCNPATGACSNPAVPEGTGCNDGNPCTQPDLCQAGRCVGANLACTPSDQCHTAGTCDTGTGVCSSPEKDDETSCDDGNSQTQKDSCEGGTCVGRTPCIAVKTMGAGASHTCAVRTDGILWCWGWNDKGQLGNGTNQDSLVPVRVPGQGWSSVSGGLEHTCAIRTDGTLWCWGADGWGQLGNGTNQNSSVPVQVPGTNWVSVEPGDYHTCGVKRDGTLWCWGWSGWGQFGAGTGYYESWTPVQRDGEAWTNVHGGSSTVCGTRTDATLWCWGANAAGQLGNGSVDGAGPVQVGGAEWRAESTDGWHNCGIKTDGTLWCWGWNGWGQLGNGTFDGSTTPVMVPGAGWASIAVGSNHTCSAREDGTLWCWGAIQIGNGGPGYTPNPTRVRGRDWADVAAGGSHACGRRQDGSLWCWGGNGNGQLGDGTAANKPVPVQVAGTLCQVVPVCGNGIVDAGETCDDGNTVSGDGCSADCQIEKCFGVVCPTGDQCNNGGCDPATGQCVLSAKADGVSCNGGNPCTQGGTCQAGVCVGANPVACAASDQCHAAGTCDPSTGVCGNPALPDGTSCNDGNACTQTDTCQAGVCVGANPVGCAGASDQCHDMGICDPATGTCSSPAKADGTGCNDGNPCTLTDTCQGGTCIGSNPVVCAASDQCHAAGICDPSTGVCTNPAQADGTSCNDGNACSRTDTCQAGTCTGGNWVGCTPQDQCHDVGECNPANGTCSSPLKANGVACSDGNACTRTDTCQNGTCTGANPVICTALDQCHVAGMCNSSTGVCSNPNKADGTACNDNNLCTRTDTCVAGTCVGSNPIACGSGNQCQAAGICDPATAMCLHSGKADGTACDDGSDSTSSDSCQAGACVGIPALPPPVVANLADTLAYIYQGTSPSQTGVTAGTIQYYSAAGIRGRILTRDGSPLAAVKVAIAGHPELGATASRADGGYDLVVNGGGTSTVQMSKSGYLPVDRPVQVPWQGFGQVDDVVMITTDPQVTMVDLSQSVLQVAAGSVVTDSDGTRQATVLVPPGTQATMDLPNGTAVPISTLSIRVTEYTVGDTGPAAMPAPLPLNTAYTYAVDYTVDEALAVGAQMIHFTQPLYHYMENFLGFAVGSGIPAGYYDTSKHMWVPSRNGSVVQILSVTGGLAQLDVDGSGSPVPLVGRQAMGITDSELGFLAQRYEPGQTLWRVPVGHFSTWDFNKGGAPPPGAGPPGANGSSGGGGGGCANSCCMPNSGGPGPGPPPNPGQTLNGSIIETQNQVLGERVAIAGTPFSLNYRSSRVGGFKAADEVLVNLAGASLPPSLTNIKLNVAVAGRTFEQDFTPTPNLGYSFVWDGKDSLGRLVSGRQVASVRVGYEYPLVYTNPPGGNSESDITFGSFSDSVTLSGTPGRTTMTSWQGLPASDTTIGTYLAKGAGLGAWTIDTNHVYDFDGLLWRGDGEREQPVTRGTSGTVILPGYSTASYRIATAADGSIYLTGQDPDVEVSPNGMDGGEIWKLNPATGIHTMYFTTDGTPAAEKLCAWNGRQVMAMAAAPDSSVYFSAYPCFTASVYVDHVGADGTYIGNWMVEAASPTFPYYPVGSILAIAVGPDGTPYYLDQIGTCLRVMKLEADGRTSQVAGGDCTQLVAGGDGGPASAATFKAVSAALGTPPADLAIGPDGSIYVTNQSECRVRQISPSGIINTVAGTTCPSAGSHTGDGGLATAALIKPTAIAIDRDGTLLIGDSDYWEVNCTAGYPGCGVYGGMTGRSRIRAVRNGVINSIAGAQVTYAPENSPALQRFLGVLNDMAIGADGDIYYVESLYGRPTGLSPDANPNAIRRIHGVLPGVPQTIAIQLASQNGQEVYGLNRSGQHLSTQDALTGAIRYQFGYDAAGMLATITDANGLVTTVDRDPDTGLATAIVAPNGQRTALTMSDDGYLTAIDEPGGAHREFSYDSGGLLQTYKKPNQATASFTYDGMGRLVHEDMPGGGSWTLTRTGPTPQNVTAPVQVSAVSAEGKTWTCGGVTDSLGNVSRTSSGPSGLPNTAANMQSGLNTQATPDGMTWSVTEGADPRFGMQAPVPATTVVTTPGGKVMTTTIARSTTMSGASLASQVDTTTVNGNVSTTTYNVAANTITNVSPLGRQTVSTLDAQGRVVNVQAGNLAPTAYSYDSRGRLATVTVGSGTSARVTTYAYDNLDRLASVTDPLLRVQSYVYDDANRVVGQVFTDGSEVTFSYDANGNVTSVTPPSRPEHDFGYTPADLMSSYTPPAVAGTGATTYEYNLDKQPIVIHRPDGSTINFTYDSAGRLATTTYPKGPDPSDGTVTVTRTYSPTTGKLTGMTSSDGQSLAYAYDGNLSLSTTWSGTVAGSVGRTYDNNFRAGSESVNGANTVALGYDNDGLLTSVDGLSITRDPTNGLITDSTVGSVTDHRTYDGFGQIATYEAKFGAMSLCLVSYVRDSLGRIEQKTETIQGTTVVWNFTYDSAGRLWQVMQNGMLTATYLYDANGNRLTKATSSGTESGTYDNQDRLLTYGKWAYTYTANGDLWTKTDTTNGTITTYRYDGQGNLRHVSLPDGRAIDYVIDGRNRRVAKKVNGTLVRRWLYENTLRPAAELDGAGNLVAHYVGGLMITPTNTYRVVLDNLGTPRLLVDRATGAVVERLDLDEFGQVTGDSNPGFLAFGFAGGIYDPDTGLVRFSARDYDPETGRWTSKDPIRFRGGDTGLYGYVWGDPVNDVDSTGLKKKGDGGNCMVECSNNTDGEIRICEICTTPSGTTNSCVDHYGFKPRGPRPADPEKTSDSSEPTTGQQIMHQLMIDTGLE